MFSRSRWQPRLSAAVENSRWGQAIVNSVLCRAVFGLTRLTVRSLDASASFLATQVVPSRPPSDFQLFSALVSRSWCGRAFSGLFLVPLSPAWRASRIGGWWNAQRAALGRAQRIRLMSWLVIVAALTRAALDPSTLFSARVGGIAWIALLLAAIAVFAAAPCFGPKPSSRRV